MSKVNNTYAYLFSLEIMLQVFWYNYVGMDVPSVLIGIIVMVVLFHKDTGALLDAGLKVPSAWWILLPPIYVIRRGMINNQTQFTIIGVLMLCINFTPIMPVLFPSSLGGGTVESRNLYCGTVTEILEDSNIDAKCLVVEKVEKITTGYYRALARLSNGRDVPITVEWKDNSNYEVTIN